MDDPVVGGYSARPGGAAPRDQPGYDVDRRSSTMPHAAGGAVAQAPLLPHTTGYDPALQERVERLRPGARPGPARPVRLRRPRRRRLARASRRLAAGAQDGDRARARNRKINELFKKNMKAIGMRIELDRRAVAREPEGRACRQATRCGRWACSPLAPDWLGRVCSAVRQHAGRRPEHGALQALPALDALYERIAGLPDGPERARAVRRSASDLALAYMPYKYTSTASRST